MSKYIYFLSFRVNIDNPDWIPPSTRNDARYFEDEEGGKAVSGVRYVFKNEKYGLKMPKSN